MSKILERLQLTPAIIAKYSKVIPPEPPKVARTHEERRVWRADYMRRRRIERTKKAEAELKNSEKNLAASHATA